MSPVRTAWKDYREAARRFSRPARLFLICEVLAWAAHGIHYVLFNLYLVEGGYSESFVGRAISVNALGLALAALPSGVLADRWGRRNTLMLGVLLEGAGLALRSAMLDPTMIIGGSFLMGMGQALVFITAAPFITDQSTPRERTHLFSTFFSLSLIAGVVGSMIGGGLPWLLLRLPEAFALETIVAYRITLVLAGFISVAALIPLRAMGDLNEKPVDHERDPVPKGARRHLIPIGLNSFLLGAGAGLVIPFMNLYFSSRFDSTTAEIGIYFSIAQVFTAFAAMLGPFVARFFGKLRTAVGMELASLPFLITLGLENRIEIAVVAFLLRATLMQASSPLHHAFIMEALPRGLRAQSSSINTTLWHGGWAVSATFAGVIIERFGYAVPFQITAVLYFAAATMFFLYFRRFQGAEPRRGLPGRGCGGARRGSGHGVRPG